MIRVGSRNAGRDDLRGSFFVMSRSGPKFEISQEFGDRQRVAGGVLAELQSQGGRLTGLPG